MIRKRRSRLTASKNKKSSNPAPWYSDLKLLIAVMLLGSIAIWILLRGGTVEEYSYDLFVSDVTNKSNTSTDANPQNSEIINQPPTSYPTTPTMGTTSAPMTPETLVLIPPSGPDPTVTEHISFAWTELNGTERTRVREDPYLSRMRPSNTTRAPECPPTCQLRLDTTTWVVTSLDCDGKSKQIGGDEYYITYRSNGGGDSIPKSTTPTAVSRTKDREDGTYQLDFWASPFADPTNNTTTDNNGGYLTVHFEYTCGLGKLPVPTKQEWRTGGAVMTSYRDIPVSTTPPIQAFVPPNTDHRINLGKYDRVMVYGDSNLYNLVSGNYGHRTNLKKTQKPDNPLIPGRPLNRLFLSKSHWFLNETIQEEEEILYNISIANNQIKDRNASIAILYGSHTWDLVFGDQGRGVGPNYERHLGACRTLITTTQQRFPQVDIYWHSGYALQLHISDDSNTRKQWFTRDPLKYMSWSRSVELHELQLQLMDELNVPVLFFLEATYLAAEHYAFLDSRHIGATLSRKLLDWYYPE